jgi:hypothetical protein
MSAIIGAFVAMTKAIKTYWYEIRSIFISKKVDGELTMMLIQIKMRV